MAEGQEVAKVAAHYRGFLLNLNTSYKVLLLGVSPPFKSACWRVCLALLNLYWQDFI